MISSTSRLAELGFYALAGHAQSARQIIDEVRDGEALGFGTAFISERYNKKEAATLSGAAGAVSENLIIATACTNHNTRHLMVTAGYARTMQSLTGGRFVLGLGRGIPVVQKSYGMSAVTTAQLEDVAGLLRRLFRGETIMGHDGPAGKFPALVVFRHPRRPSFARGLLDEVGGATRHLSSGVRRPARQHQSVGYRRPGTVPGRLHLRSIRGSIDSVATTAELEHLATLIPPAWLAPSATGSPVACVAEVRNQLALGCDAVIMHGATPAELAPIVAAYRQAVTASAAPPSMR